MPCTRLIGVIAVLLAACGDPHVVNGYRSSMGMGGETKLLFELRGSADTKAAAVAFVGGTHDLVADFDAELVGGTGFGDANEIVVKLRPKTKTEGVKVVYLVVSRKDHRVTRSVVVGLRGFIVDHEFSGQELDVELDDMLFDESAYTDYERITPDEARDRARPRTRVDMP